MDPDIPQPVRREPVLIIGAGPAGLATAAMLQRLGIASRILEAGPEVGYSWTRYYRNLRLHTGRRISSLPGYRLPRGYPEFVPRAAFQQYLRAYARRFNLSVTLNTPVTRAERGGAGWRVHTADRVWEAPVLVAATGIGSKPHTPPLPGLDQYRGRVIHSSAYVDAAPFAGQDALVVGMGNSGTEIGMDLATAARSVTLSVRSGIAIVPRRMAGVPTSNVALGLSYLPPRVVRPVRALLGRRWLARLAALGVPSGAADQFPVIGFEILDAIEGGRVRVAPGLAGFSEDAVLFSDGSRRAFDVVVLATGFRPALDWLEGYVAVPPDKQPRFPVQAPGQPNLYIAGLYYDGLRGLIYTAGRQARQIAHLVKASGAAHLPDTWVERAPAR
jgi:indole-3-pyruvate monooxygenase